MALAPGDLSDALERPAPVAVLATVDGLGAALLWLLFVVFLAVVRDSPHVVGVLFTGVFGVLAVAATAAALGLWDLRPWARTVQIGLCFVSLLAFPFGTAVAAFILWYLFQPHVKILFSGRKADELLPDEVSLLRRKREDTGAVVVVVVSLGVVFLVGLVFSGIITAIAVPNLVNAVNRARQKRTVADMQTLGHALEAYAVYRGRYPAGASSADDLTAVLVPEYLSEPLPVDAWEHAFVVEVSETGYRVVSLARDGEPGERRGGGTYDFDADIVYENGRFTQWPKGLALAENEAAVEQP